MSLAPDIGGCFEGGFRPGRGCSMTGEGNQNAEKRSVRDRQAYFALCFLAVIEN
jgi:hypothetical protein